MFASLLYEMYFNSHNYLDDTIIKVTIFDMIYYYVLNKMGLPISIILHHLLKTIRIYFNSKKTPLEWQFLFFLENQPNLLFI